MSGHHGHIILAVASLPHGLGGLRLETQRPLNKCPINAMNTAIAEVFAVFQLYTMVCVYHNVMYSYTVRDIR